jgi:hypothetical protein
MKSLDSTEAEEVLPVLIEDSEYMVFKSNNLDLISNSSSGELILDDNVLEENWGWLYSRFSRVKVRWTQTLYLLSFIFQGFCFVVWVATTNYKNPSHANIPFTVDPYFKIIIWAGVLFLGLPFIFILYKKNISSLNLIGRSVKLLYLPVYYLTSVLFINRTLSTYPYSLLTQDTMIICSLIIVLLIYYKVKYKDDGRYKVGYLEFLGVQVHFSGLLACLMVEMIECLFLSFGFYEDTDKKDSKLFNWENEKWTILVMTLSFWTGCLSLYLYKDIIYPFVLSFTYFGIVSIQVRIFCNDGENSCSESVTKAAVALGSILVFFIIITIITYPKLVLYSVRNNRNNRG